MLENNPEAMKFLDSKETTFRDLHHTCNVVYCDLHDQGIGTDVRHARVFSQEEESKLWETGVLGITTPKRLQHAVFYYTHTCTGKCFCIRGGEEQRRLGPSHFICSEKSDCYTYVEHGSKNRSGGLAQLRIENKGVPCYAVPDKNPACLVFLLDIYLNKLPQHAYANDVLYCRPKPKTPVDASSP